MPNPVTWISDFGSACRANSTRAFRLVIPSLCQLVEEDLSLLQIEGVKTFGEAVV
jgi:hypothetical protein